MGVSDGTVVGSLLGGLVGRSVGSAVGVLVGFWRGNNGGIDDPELALLCHG